MATTKYVTGLDLGQAADFTALAVLEQTRIEDPYDPPRTQRHYAVRHLQRFALGTPYTTTCEEVASTFWDRPLAGTTLAVDQTGVGRPVVDMHHRTGVRAKLQPITHHRGSQVEPWRNGRLARPEKGVGKHTSGPVAIAPHLAMEALKRAIAAGYNDIASMKKDSDLDALRDREDFKKLFAELEAKAKAKK